MLQSGHMQSIAAASVRSHSRTPCQHPGRGGGGIGEGYDRCTWKGVEKERPPSSDDRECSGAGDGRGYEVVTTSATAAGMRWSRRRWPHAGRRRRWARFCGSFFIRDLLFSVTRATIERPIQSFVLAGGADSIPIFSRLAIVAGARVRRAIRSGIDCTIVPCPLAAGIGKQDKSATTKHKTRARTSHQHEKRKATRLRTQLDDACPKQRLATAVRPPETCWCAQSAAVAVASAPITDLLLDGEFTGGVKNRHRP